MPRNTFSEDRPKRSDALIRAQAKYREKNFEMLRENNKIAVKKYAETHHDEILERKKLSYEWKSFLTNENLRKENKLFLRILLEDYETLAHPRIN